MQVEPWFSHEVRKGFRKWENGVYLYYALGKARQYVYGICFLNLEIVSLSSLTKVLDFGLVCLKLSLTQQTQEWRSTSKTVGHDHSQAMKSSGGFVCPSPL